MIIEEQVEIAKITTMRLGGRARYVINIEDKEALVRAVGFAEEQNLPIFILGDGANVIGRDEGFSGVILKSRLMGREVLKKTEKSLIIRASAGENWDELVEFISREGYSGVEAMAKIPGTVGAAPVQNIGAYGQEIKDTLISVEVYDLQKKEFKELKNEELRFAYRRSIFNIPENKNRYFITAITLELNKKEMIPPFYTSLQKYVEDHKVEDFSATNIYRIVSEIRTEKLPDPQFIANSGSFFKNIVIDKKQAETLKQQEILVWQTEDGQFKVSAGWLIDQAGLKGMEFDGFRVWGKAALILVNEKAKNYKDLEKARKEIIRLVKERFNLSLEQEPVELV